MTEQASHVVWFEELGRTDVARVGGKNASLGEMVRHLGQRGVTVPPGFATTAQAYWRFVDANSLGDRIATALLELKTGKAPLSEVGQTIRRAFLRGEWPEDMAEAFRGQCQIKSA
jgi:pyruvate,water dikinase